ncbi:MAG: hypothetical protein MMC33_001059 [Icmadophila ericetorum]|nr:hypothetical protein [Icmadophila ericetorum]
MHRRVQNLVAGLAAKGIIVIEWGSLLYSRYDVPLVYTEFSFLVDDDFIEAACLLTEEQGFPPTESIPILIRCHGKYETIARHFGRFRQRVNLFPRFFAGFRANEMCLAPLNLSDAYPSVLIAKPAPIVASLVRLISQVHFTDPMSSILRHDLCMMISYSLFDMSYEGSYIVLDEESEDDVEQQRRQTVKRNQTWEGWRGDEVWIADAVQAIIQGNGNYDFLPATLLGRAWGVPFLPMLQTT